MGECNIKFNTDNASFREYDGDLNIETSNILKDILSKINQDINEGILHDTNGNKIGQWSVD